MPSLVCRPMHLNKPTPAVLAVGQELQSEPTRLDQGRAPITATLSSQSIGPACVNYFFQLFQKIYVPRLVEVIISGFLSPLRSTSATCDPMPDRL